jgi:hypothetical protein
MHDIKKYMFIYFAIINYTNPWCDGQIVKAFGCGQRGQGSNPPLDISCLWHHHDEPHCQTYKKNFFSTI